MIYADAASKRARYVALRASLWATRASGFDDHWRELAEWVIPRRTRFWAGDRNRGDKRSQRIIDSTARFSVRTLQSGLHAGLTSPARPWMKLTTFDPRVAEKPDVKIWLSVHTQRMLDIFQSSNLYNVLPIIYGDMGLFGTACMSVLGDDHDLFRCYAYPIGSYALGQDRRGIVSTFVRDYELSVRQVVEEFALQPDKKTIDWSRISMAVKANWDKGMFESPVPVTWMVTPNEDYRETSLLSKHLKFSSCHWETGSPENLFLRESGFQSFPIMAPRWDITGEDTYGTDCPGMTALGDIKQLQIEQRTKGKAIAKMVDPPLTGPSALRTQKTSLLPGDITYLDVRDGNQGLKSIHDIGLNLSHLAADIGQVQYRIQRAFYEDLFLMLARADQQPQGGGQPVTAREIEERHEEKLLSLGPVLERTGDELLGPMVNRVWALMIARGLVDKAPQAIQGKELKVQYTSIMAQAQKLVGVVGLDRFMVSVLQTIEQFPETKHKVIIMNVVDDYADMLGVDPRNVRPTADAQALVDADNKAAAEAQQSAAAEQMSKTASNLGNTPASGDTALSRITGAVSGSPVGPAGAAGQVSQGQPGAITALPQKIIGAAP